MLVNWYLSEFSEDHYIDPVIHAAELKLMAIQFCTHLLAAGVLRQIPDKNVPMYSTFKVFFLTFYNQLIYTIFFCISA